MVLVAAAVVADYRVRSSKEDSEKEAKDLYIL
jgi:hypothetical protein